MGTVFETPQLLLCGLIRAMISRILLAAVVALASVSTSDAFTAPGLALRGAAPRIGMSSAKRIPAKTAPTMQVQELADATLLAASIWPQPMVDGVTAYMNIFVPTFKSLNLPAPLVQWGHAFSMGTVIATMGVYGSWLGWQIRQNPSQKNELAPGPAWANLGKSVSELHSTLTGAMALIFFLGANGGLVLSLVQDKPIMESAHFTTAMGGFLLLAMQASLTTRFQTSSAATARTTHAFLGSATMGVFFYQAYLGLQLGLKYAAPAVVASL